MSDVDTLLSYIYFPHSYSLKRIQNSLGLVEQMSARSHALFSLESDAEDGLQSDLETLLFVEMGPTFRCKQD